MSEKEMLAYVAKCEKLSNARVYESDKEVADSIKNIPVRTANSGKRSPCVFAVKKA